jgi:flap endonuclease-1
MPESRKLPVQELHFEKLMTVLGLSHAQFVDLCILMGCDYVPNIKGIGPKKAFELIKKHENIETILENIDTKKYTPVENWQYKDARRLFVEPEVFKVICLFKKYIQRKIRIWILQNGNLPM